MREKKRGGGAKDALVFRENRKWVHIAFATKALKDSKKEMSHVDRVRHFG